jgi:hypothetical protein
MEQRGRNRWQTFRLARPRERLELSETVATGCHRLPFGSHGKEGVDGSSPSEGLKKNPANGQVVLPVMTKFGLFAGTRRVHFGTGGQSRARGTSRGTARNVLETLDRDHSLEKAPANGDSALPEFDDGSV